MRVRVLVMLRTPAKDVGRRAHEGVARAWLSAVRPRRGPRRVP
ncbi:hypothetical protein STVIR_4218 [Streptomyces viridochromogenes Tue57]|uniref:Uncharacterized protein n=1 Tax=Streptomyces viridochromogenes Tue57 TaxID=1160705 RepID=L8PB04_STRVR|nr:hypothetical protein STVIR_4218 [Streptomyces viridochromogenes Tue57]